MNFTTPHLPRKTTVMIIAGCLFVLVLTALIYSATSSRMSGRSVGMLSTPSATVAQNVISTDSYGGGSGYSEVKSYASRGAMDTAYREASVALEQSDAIHTESVSDSLIPEDAMVAPSPEQVDAPKGERKIIRSAELDILVRDTDVASDGIRAVSDAYQGQRGDEHFSQYGQDLRRGTISIWVPSEHFDEAVRDIKALALRVNTESIRAQDVSAQHVDLTARLKNLHATEAQYQDLLSRSGSIEEVLQVTQQLVQTRQVIEQLQGQLDSLSAHVALSAITVHITPEYTVASTDQVFNEWRPGAVIKNAYHDLQQRLILVSNKLIVSIIVGLPLLIVSLVQLMFWVGLLLLIGLSARRIYRRLQGEQSVPPKSME
jgi:hypothetical protein